MPPARPDCSFEGYSVLGFRLSVQPAPADNR
jgi:hypothetical protein